MLKIRFNLRNVAAVVACLVVAVVFLCATAIHAQDQAKINKLTKEATEIVNRAAARGSLNEQEQVRLQEIEKEMAAESNKALNNPQVKRIVEQQQQQEQQKAQKQEAESLEKAIIKVPVPEKLSVKYKSAEYRLRGETLIITWDNNLKRVRTDVWYGGGSNEREINIVDAVKKTYIQHHYGGWQDSEFSAAEMYNKTGYLRERVGTEEQLLARWGRAFVKQSLPDRTYAGKSCKVFLLTEVKNDYTLYVTYALWNNVVLFYEYKSTQHRESKSNISATYEAILITENVPETAFTQTLNISWLQ